MRVAFQKYAEQGAMTLEEVAAVLRRSETWVRTHSSGSNPLIPRIKGRPIRFDPEVLIEVFCRPQESSSLKIDRRERRKTGEKPTGGYRTCL